MRSLSIGLSFTVIMFCFYAPVVLGQVTYCTPTGACPANDKAYITLVKFNTLNNSSACNGYTLFPESGAATTTVEQGASYQMTVGFYGYYYDPLHGVYTYYIQTARVYIDFNADGDFDDAGEYILIGNGNDSKPAAAMIPIPADARPGKTRMRVRHGAGTLTACNSLATDMYKAYDIEDYTITIAQKNVAAPSCASSYSPANNAVNVPRNPGLTFTWSGATGGTGTVYDFYLGTSPTSLTAVAVNIVSADGVTAKYSFPNFLEPATIYYYKIVPKNDHGTANACSVQKFTTASSTNDYYCTPQANCSIFFDSYIKSVNFNALSNISTCSGQSGYMVYPAGGATTTSVTKGMSYTLGIGTSLACNLGYLGAWIDYNHNGNFNDAGEFIAIPDQDTGNSCDVRTVSIAIPTGAVTGTTRMRIRLSADNAVRANESCQDYDGGETEDYTITISAQTACSGLTATYTKTDNTGSAGATGSITVTPVGGVPPYSISWSAGTLSGFNLAGLSAGIYYATISDGAGCSYAMPPINISAPPAFILNGISVMQPGCKENGSIRADVSGGVGPYSFQWSNGASGTSFINNLDSGTYSVTISDSQGQVLSSGAIRLHRLSALYTVVPAVCGTGATGAIHVTTMGGMAPYKYKWIQTKPGDPVFLETADLPAAAGVYEVTITDAENCSLVISNIEVPGPKPPVLDVAIKPANCNGNGSATGEIWLSTVNGTAPYRYEAYAGGSLQSLASVNDAGGFRYINVPVAQSYTLVAYDANGCQSGYINTDGVNLLPEPNAAWGFMMACSGKPAEVKYGGYVAGMDFIWYADATGATALDTAVVFTTPVLNQTVTYYMANYQHGCRSQTIIPYTVSVARTPDKPAVIAAGPTVLCNGSSVSLQAPQGYAEYRWSNGAQTMTVTTGTAGSYTVQVEDDFGCESPVSDPVDVYNGPPSAIPVIIASGPLTFCSGGEVVLSAPQGYTTYRWSDNSTTQNVTIRSAGVYTVRATAPGACESDESDPVEVTVTPALDAPVISATGPLAFCTGGQVVLSTSGGGQYRWSTGDTAPLIRVTESGTYTVTITINGCESLAAEATVFVFDLPASPKSIEQSSPSTLRVTGAGEAYVWTFRGNVLPVSTAEIVVSESGHYEARSISEHGCLSEGIVGYDFVVTGLEQIVSDSFSVYPNPSPGTLHVDAGNGPVDEMQIINALGQSFHVAQAEQGGPELSLDVSALPAGLYTLLIKQGSRIVARSFVKQ